MSLEAASVRVKVDRAKLSARCFLTPAGAAAFVPDDLAPLVHLLTDEHGLVGVDEAALADWARAGELERPVVVATGTPAEDGTDGRIEYVYREKARERIRAQREATQVDYKEWGAIETVTPGEALALVLPPTPGRAGRDVYGEEIAPKAGRTMRLEAGKHVECCETPSGAVLKSVIEGIVSISGTKIEVSPAYIVAGDVDMTVGNVRFNGDVIVRGEVREGFTVEATGSIEVQKDVDKGSLTAGGDVTVVGTIFGKEDAWVRAGGAVRAHSAKNANIEAGGEVRIPGNTIQSHIIAGRATLGSTVEAFVRGGVVETTGDIAVGSVGSPERSLVTHLEITWPEALVKELLRFKEERESITTGRGEIERQLLNLRRVAERGRALPAAQAERLKKLEAQAHQFREKETELQFSRDTIAAEVQTCRGSAITVYGDIHPDALFSIHGKTMAIHESRGPLRLEATKDGLRTLTAPEMPAAEFAT